MRFKVFNTDVYISFTFIAVFIMMHLYGNGYIYICGLISSLGHELIHMIAILLSGNKIRKISFSIFGGNIYRDTSSVNYLNEAIINLSAPIVNIMMGAIFLVFGYEYLGCINLFIGLINICPFYNFDGGRGLESFLKIRYAPNFCERIMFITSLLTLVIFFFILFYLLYMECINVFLIIIILYLICCFCVKIFNKNDNLG